MSAATPSFRAHSAAGAERHRRRPSLIPVDTGRPGDLLAVARHPHFIPKVAVMEPHVHALSSPIDLLLYRRRSICCRRWTLTRSCPKLLTQSARLRHCFPAMQRHHYREHLHFVELRVRRLLQVSSGHHEDHPVTESLLQCCVYCCSNNTLSVGGTCTRQDRFKI
jgi:hypothetical protein